MADPAVIQVMRAFKRLLLDREGAQMARMARSWLEVEDALQTGMESLARELAEAKAAGQVVSQAKLYRMRSYQRLMAQVQQQMAGYTGYAEGAITAEQAMLAQLGVEHSVTATALAADATALAADAGGSIGVFFDVLPVEAVQNMVGLTGSGSPLGALLKASWGDAADGLTRALLRGTALGWNPRKTAREMRQGLTGGLDRVLNIARTEQMRVYREAGRAQYERSGVVEGFRRLATHDDRVCVACLMSEGEVYSLRESLRDHPSGRCTMVPMVKGMPSVKWELGPDWFRGQPEGTQRKILGPGKLAAWQKGEFRLADLVTVKQDAVWGDRVEPTPLKALVGQ